jgi:mannobiose 2-epimerase
MMRSAIMLPFVVVAFAGCRNAQRTPTGPRAVVLPTRDAYLRLADEAEANLQEHVLRKWFPRAVDREHGGFYTSFNEDWSPGKNNDKTLVYQSRLTWVAARAAQRYPEQAEAYLGYTRHGLDCLAHTMWDREFGGFFWELDEHGHMKPDRKGEKHAYGIAFGIYAAATNYTATRDARALELARRAFTWLDEHAHDAQNGGYYEALTQQGQPMLAPPPGRQADAIGTRYGYKSMNSHIHLLEAFTALHEVWPDATLRARLQEVFELVRDKIAVEPGCLNLYFTPGWRPLPDHDSFGHDVETAYLLVEAAAALGQPEDARTWTVARQLVDHALDYGWDRERGGFYDGGSAFGAPTRLEKVWWTQAEGLNALLLMHERFGREMPRYWQAFVQEWEFISTRQVDHRHGGWYASVSPGGKAPRGRPKSDGWTEAYHQARALWNVSAALRRLAGETSAGQP